tara:strand:- start:648 stop:1016 length:369 start_codon:yes stop_codon:yes gene_type:complete
MIEVFCSGPKGGQLGEEFNSLLENYIYTACEELKIKKKKKFEIEVLVFNKFPKETNHCLGYCYGDTSSITIEITKDQEDFFLTLAHEMIHVKQFLEGRYPSEREADAGELKLHQTVSEKIGY